MSLFSEDAMELQAMRAGWKEKQAIIERQAAQIEGMREALEAAYNRLRWWMDVFPLHVTEADNEEMLKIVKALSTTPDQSLERFAERVRKQCAEVCFDRAKRPNDGYWTDAGWETVCSANQLAGEDILEIKELP